MFHATGGTDRTNNQEWGHCIWFYIKFCANLYNYNHFVLMLNLLLHATYEPFQSYTRCFTHTCENQLRDVYMIVHALNTMPHFVCNFIWHVAIRHNNWLTDYNNKTSVPQRTRTDTTEAAVCDRRAMPPDGVLYIRYSQRSLTEPGFWGRPKISGISKSKFLEFRFWFRSSTCWIKPLWEGRLLQRTVI